MPAHPPATLPAPSDDLLSLLAALSPSQAPSPDFLCPYPIPVPPPSSARRRRTVRRASSSTDSTTASSPSKPDYLTVVPPRYTFGDDSRWHPAEWTLHGRTFHPTASTSGSSVHTTEITTADIDSGVKQAETKTDADGDGDVDDDDASYNSSVTDVFYKEEDMIASSLPTGWGKPTQRTKFYDAPMIIVLSLIIAIAVTLIIAGCVLTHKNRKSARKKAQEAKEAGLPLPDDLDVERDAESVDLADKEAEMLKMLAQTKKKERMWDKWRRQGQARLGGSLRKRKRKNVATPRGELEEEDSPEGRTVTGSPGRSPRGSFSSSRTRLSVDPNVQTHPLLPLPTPTPLTLVAVQTIPIPLSISIPDTPPPPASPPPPLLPSSTLPPSSSPPPLAALPPAYCRTRSRTAFGKLSQPDAEDASGEASAHVQDTEYMDGDMCVPLRGHVATDDKAVLERMRRAVSEPDFNVNANAVNATVESGAEPVVPVWEDERIEDFGGYNVIDEENIGEGTSSQYPRPQIRIETANSNSSTSLLLPPPPSAISLSPSTTSLFSTYSHPHSHSYAPSLSHSSSHQTLTLTLPPPPTASTHSLVQRHLDRNEEVQPYYVPTFPDVDVHISDPSAHEMVMEMEVMASAPPLEVDIIGEDVDMAAASAPPLEDEDYEPEFDEDAGQHEDEDDGRNLDADADETRTEQDLDANLDDRFGSGSDVESLLDGDEVSAASSTIASSTHTSENSNASNPNGRPRGRERHNPLPLEDDSDDDNSDRRISTASLPMYEP
ncbi:hypothetical protein M422DRAFT_241553 [Sphaerobolus stellatus SS14]|nr:hypothetical protein M422DRAFT_241553 [Sphaerobolus stellatus SS14]